MAKTVYMRGRGGDAKVKEYSATSDIPAQMFGEVSGILYFNNGTTTAEVGAASAFTDLTDVPASYSGGSLKALRVNSTEDAIEFATATFTGDVPSLANDFDVNATGLTPYNTYVMTLDTANSQYQGASTSSTPRGFRLESYPAAGARMLVVLEVTECTGKWVVKDWLSGTNTLGYITKPGRYTFRWKVTAGGASQRAFYVANDSEAATTATQISIGYFAVFVNPNEASRNLSAPDDGVQESMKPTLGARSKVPATNYATIYGPYISTSTSDTEGSQVGIGDHVRLDSFTTGYAGYTYSAAGGQTAVGSYAEARHWRSTAVGAYATAPVVSSTALGFWTFCGWPHGVTLGRGTVITDQVPIATDEMPFGSNTTDWYINGGWAHIIPHPRNPTSLTLSHHVTPSTVKECRLHGFDAYDARAGGSATADSQVADTTARDAIAAANRWPGMRVYVTGLNETHTLERAWGDDLSVNTWGTAAGDTRSFNVAGGNLNLAAGRGTGSGASGKVNIETAPVASANPNAKNTLVVAAQVDALVDAVNHYTRLLLLDTANGTLYRVKMGADNSGPGGSGRALYVDNA